MEQLDQDLLIAHEIAHFVLKHNRGIGGKPDYEQEQQAWRLATEWLQSK